MTITVTCPGCKTTLNLSDQVIGKTIRCKNCQTVFAVGTPAKAQEVPASIVPVVKPAPVRHPNRPDPVEESIQSRPGPRIGKASGGGPPRPRRPMAESRGIPLWVFLAGGAAAAVLLMVFGLVAAWFWLSEREHAGQVVAAEAANQRPEAAPRLQADVEQKAAPANPALAPDLRPKPDAPDLPPANPPRAKQAEGAGAANSTPIPPQLLEAIKKATVFVKVDSGLSAGRGSGFLMNKDGAIAYVVTNHHVITPPTADPFRPKFGPPRFLGPRMLMAPPATVTIVFASGTANEQSFQAEVLAADKDRDLAILQVKGVAKLPEPIDWMRRPELIETMPVYIFGFPFGELLDEKKSNPAITVGQGAISAIRRGDRGELDFIQVDIDMNPGNSGGPVVDGRGRLVGIAVSGIKGTRINRVIPPDKLSDMVAGQVSSALIARKKVSKTAVELQGEVWLFDPRYKIRLTAAVNSSVSGGNIPTPKKDAAEIQVEVKLLDPMKKIQAVAVHYRRAENGMPDRPANADGTWPPLTAAQQENLKIDGQKASTTISIANVKTTDQYEFQIAFRNSDGRMVFTQPRTFALNRPAMEIAQKPPGGVPGAGVPQVPAGPDQPPPPPLTEHRPLTKGEMEQTLAALKSSNAFHRKDAAERLVQADPKEGREQVAKALEPLLEDPDHFTRQAAIKAMGLWGTKDSVPQLLKLLKHPDIFTRRSAIGALGNLQDERAIAPVAECLVDFQTRGDAGKALEAIGSKAEKEVIKFLKHDDIFLRANACTILKVIGTKDSIKPLQRVIANPDIHNQTHVAPAAREALQAIKGRERKR